MASMQSFVTDGRILSDAEREAILEQYHIEFKKMIKEKDFVPVELYYEIEADKRKSKIQYIGTDPKVIYWAGYNHYAAIAEHQEVSMSWCKRGEWIAYEEDTVT